LKGLKETLAKLTPKEAKRVEELRAILRKPWYATPGPQMEALLSKADVTGFGGAAGGGKTALAVGLAVTEHRTVGIFRQNGTELRGIYDEVARVLGTRDGLAEHKGVWTFQRFDGQDCQIEFGSFPSPGDVEKYRGRPHDLLVFDEAQSMRELDVRFLMGWLRTTGDRPDQRCRALFTFNPPTTVEGRWLVAYFAPWLDKKHPNPAKPGELRWFAQLGGRETEVDSGTPFEHNGEKIIPQSRTFVPSRLDDNPYLKDTGYRATVMAMPEPLRSQMLYGDFTAGTEDDAFQCIPTAWVEAAMARWKPLDVKPPMDSLGADIAQGGRDNTILARRHGYWFDVPIVHPGKDCRDGPTTAGFILAAVRDGAVIHLDLFGVGAQPYGALMKLQQSVYGVNVGDPAPGLDLSGRMEFFNLRSQLVWRMREALDPVRNNGIALPPDRRLLADLCAYTWEPQGRRIKVHDRQSMVDKLGRSPDFGSAYLLALMDTPCLRAQAEFRAATQGKPYDPMAAFERSIGFSR